MHEYSRPLISLTERGLYCESGGFFIDPRRVVDLAIVTHSHSDHARRGSRRYLCEVSGLGLLRTRLGKKIVADGLQYGERIRLGDVEVSLHSAGHILGSAQVRIQRDSEVWVASGDYKRDPDPSCEPFEIVKCDTFITEATFGTPKFSWRKDANHGEDMARWWEINAAEGRNSILFGYSLGKAQRILAELAPHAPRPILIYHTISELTECYRKSGRQLAETRDLEDALTAVKAEGDTLRGELILAPPSILRENFVKKFGEYRTAFASGWMQGGNRGWGGGGGYDEGFVMSDHADWGDLNRTIKDCGASRVFVQHRNGVLVRHLRSLGIEAYPEDHLEPAKFARLPRKTLDLFPTELFARPRLLGRG